MFPAGFEEDDPPGKLTTRIYRGITQYIQQLPDQLRAYRIGTERIEVELQQIREDLALSHRYQRILNELLSGPSDGKYMSPHRPWVQMFMSW